MSTFLFLTIPLFGHVNYGLKIAKRLIQNGHQCYFFSGYAFKNKVEKKGVSYCRYSDAVEELFLEESTSYNNTKMNDVRSDEIDYIKEIWGLTIHSFDIIKYMLEYDIHIMPKLKPDCIIYDSIAIWGRWLADRLGIPCFSSCTSYYYSREMIEHCPEKIVGLFLKDSGLSGDLLLSMLRIMDRKLYKKYEGFIDYPVLMNSSGSGDFNFIYTTESFQMYPELIDKKKTYFAGIILDEEDFEEDISDLIEKERKNIYIALGTIFNNKQLYNMCIEALKDFDDNIIMSIGMNNKRSDLNDIPIGWKVKNRLPQINLLNEIDLFISHGGTNSVREAAYFGVPTVIIPQAGDQFFAAMDVERLHTGLVLLDEITPERIREAVLHCLTNVEIRESCKILRNEMRKCRGLEGVIQIIEEKMSLI